MNARGDEFLQHLYRTDGIGVVSGDGYPTRLAKLLPGESGVFICPPAWVGALGRVCAQWVRAHTDWTCDFPDTTPPSYVFWTCADRHGLRVNRAHLPGPHRPQHVRYTFRPLS